MSASTAALQEFLQQHPDLKREGETPPSTALYQQALASAEAQLGDNLFNTAALQQLQSLYQEQELWRANNEAEDQRHHFIITIPVADRPQQLQRCLESLLQLCELFHYGRNRNGEYKKLTLLISDDSLSADNRNAIRSLTDAFSAHGIPSIYFGEDEQRTLLDNFPPSQQATLQRLITQPEAGVHKGASTTRNLAYLKLHTLQQQWPTRERLLFWFVDSDQEFRVNVSNGTEEHDLYCINYLYRFDQTFQQHNPVMVTGKLVGDPPVSPTVMASNLLFDLNQFLTEITQQTDSSACQFHHDTHHNEGEAAYHDMTDLFGYPVPQVPYRYRCPLEGDHNHSACLEQFSQRLNQFFYGEHPTRRSYHTEQPLAHNLKPARTVYTANYLFTTEGLHAFIPFAPLKLRMAGPMLGRLLQQSLQKRFLSANLPMVHKRTLGGANHAEHRPGVAQHRNAPQRIDFSVEFERQFYGDVTLFAIEQLTKQGYPTTPCSREQLYAALSQSEAQMRERYRQQRSEIRTRLQQFTSLWSAGWWHSTADKRDKRDKADEIALQVQCFIDNIHNNFLEPSTAWAQIESTAHRQQRLKEITRALEQHPQTQTDWSSLLQ